MPSKKNTPTKSPAKRPALEYVTRDQLSKKQRRELEEFEARRAARLARESAKAATTEDQSPEPVEIDEPKTPAKTVLAMPTEMATPPQSPVSVPESDEINSLGTSALEALATTPAELPSPAPRSPLFMPEVSPTPSTTDAVESPLFMPEVSPTPSITDAVEAANAASLAITDAVEAANAASPVDERVPYQWQTRGGSQDSSEEDDLYARPAAPVTLQTESHLVVEASQSEESEELSTDDSGSNLEDDWESDKADDDDSESDLEVPDWDVHAARVRTRVLGNLRQMKRRRRAAVGLSTADEEYNNKKTIVDEIWQRFKSGLISGMQASQDLDRAEEPDCIDFEPEAEGESEYLGAHLQGILNTIKEGMSVAHAQETSDRKEGQNTESKV